MVVTTQAHTGNYAFAEATSPASPEAVLLQARQAALSLRRSRLSSESDTAFVVYVGTSFKSWGEVVTVRVHSTAAGSTVRIESRSKWALIDWGKNQNNVGAIIRSL